VKFRRTETQSDDEARTGRLLDGLETAYAVRTGDPVDGGDLTQFEETVLFAVAGDPAQQYPPAGHTYPRKG
jgi:hypothetical protein